MNPILIVGAALVGLPIILHLIMKQEPKRLPFPAFRFLKQRLKTNQRKLRLRHFVLLALRMLLIALFCLTLYQPSVLSDGLDLRGEQPLAVVVVVDTSPSMGYADSEGKTRLEEACRRALELVNGLPDGSRVAVVETGETGGDWLPSISTARDRLNDLIGRARKIPQSGTAAGGSQPVTSAVATAYQLLRTVDAESDSADSLPRLVAIFTDRAASSWDTSRVDDLKKLRDAISDPKPVHAVVDLGVDRPVNVAILSAELSDRKGQVVPANQPVDVVVAVGAIGPEEFKVAVKAMVDDGKPIAKEVVVPPGQTRTLAFDFRNLKPGLHQLRFELGTADALTVDNTRFLTLRTAEPRKVLTIADYPEEADFWKLAVNAKGEFATEVVRPAEVRTENGRVVVARPAADDPKKVQVDELQSFEAVCMFAVGKPTQPADDPLWGKLSRYVEAGGKLIVIPGGKDRMDLADYDPTKVEAANKLLPGTFKDIVETAKAFPAPNDRKLRNRAAGVPWSVFTDSDDRALQHPFLAPLKEWKLKGDVDIFRAPRKAWKYWDVRELAEGRAVANYDDDDDPAKRHPAVLERDVVDAKGKFPKGKVILLTTRMDVPTDPDREWHDYWESTGNSWAVVFPTLLLRYAAGSNTDANFTHLTGQTVTIPLAKLLDGKRDPVVLDGPGVGVADAVFRPAERQLELKVGPPMTNVPGNFTLSGANPEWKEGFSLNVAAEESTLDKVPVEGIEDLTGAGTVVSVGKNLDLREVLAGTDQLKTPVDLFPWLLIAVLVLLALEGLVANRFYRLKR